MLKSVAIAGFTLGAFLLPSIAFAGAPDPLYSECVDDSDRSIVRALRNECDDIATQGMSTDPYNVGIYRPCTPNDATDGGMSSLGICIAGSSCEKGSLTEYVCLGAPGTL